jgi:hypothetical protein
VSEKVEMATKSVKLNRKQGTILEEKRSSDQIVVKTKNACHPCSKWVKVWWWRDQNLVSEDFSQPYAFVRIVEEPMVVKRPQMILYSKKLLD